MAVNDPSLLPIGKPCTGCGTILTEDNLSVTTLKGVKDGPEGVCSTCIPKGAASIPAGMLG